MNEFSNQTWIEKDTPDGTLNNHLWLTEKDMADLKDGWRVKKCYSDICRFLIKDPKDDKVKAIYVARENAHLV